jgi:hypothetical protein
MSKIQKITLGIAGVALIVSTINLILSIMGVF